MKSYQQFFAELKRRKVFRVMAVYGATAFVVLQVADLLAQGMGLSDQVLRITTFLVLVGFPIAIVLAWAFETTPDGVRLTESATDEEIDAIIAQPAARRWTPGLLALAGVALLFGGWWMGRQGSGPELDLAVPEAQAGEFRKIAVLPLANVRGDDDSEVLAVALQEGLAQKLRGLAALRVISTGSVLEYRSSDKGDTEIAQELDVAYLVRGNVLRAGEQVQVNITLIDGGSGEPLWGDSFEQEVSSDNLFEIGSDVAVDVVREVGTRLSPEDREALSQGPPTDDLAALNAYNRARQTWYAQGLSTSYGDAVELAERAVDLDPTFVAAWALLARLRAFMVRYGALDRESARDAMLRAEELAPDGAEAITARAFYTYYAEGRFGEALPLMQRAERLVPSDGDVIAGVAYLHRRLGQLDEAVSAFERAIDVDPRNTSTLLEFGNTLLVLGRFEAADAVAERALQISPSNPGAKAQKVDLLLTRSGSVDQAKSLAAELGLDPTDFRESRVLVRLAAADGDLGEASRLADQVLRQNAVWDESLRLRDRGWTRMVNSKIAPAVGDSLLALDLEGASPGYREQVEAWGHAALGDEAAAVRLVDESLRQAQASGDYWTSLTFEWNSIILRSLLGHREEALDRLEKLVELPGFSSTYLLLDPRFAALRDDPRFDSIVARRQAYEEEQARIAEAKRPWLP